MFLRRITLSLLCAAALTGCSGSTPGAPPGGPPVTVPQLTSVTAFRDCAALRITDLVGLLDRLEAILSGADTPSVLQALGIVLTPVPGAPNTFDFQASFDLDADGVDDSFSGRIAFSGDPEQLGPGDTAQVSWDYAGGTGDVTGSGDLDITLTVDGATVSGMGMFTSTDGCEFDFMIPVSAPLPIRFPSTSSAPLLDAPNLEVQALTLGGVDIVGMMHVSITIGTDTFEADVEFPAMSNVLTYTNASKNGISLPPGDFPVFAAPFPQAEFLAMLDATMLKLGILHRILDTMVVTRIALLTSMDPPSEVSLRSPDSDGSVPYTLDLGMIRTNIPDVGTVPNVTVTGKIATDGSTTWKIVDNDRPTRPRIQGENTSGIPLFIDASGGIQNADGNISLHAGDDRVCALTFSNANLTFSAAGVEGSITRFAVLFPSQDAAVGDSLFSTQVIFDGDRVAFQILALTVNGQNVYRNSPTAPRNFELALN